MMSSNSTNSSFGRASDQVREAANNTLDSARRAGQEIGAATRTEFNNILCDLQDLAARAGKASGRELGVLREQMSDKLGAAKKKLGSVTGDATVVARKSVYATGHAIKGRPFQSVAVAALAGFVIGLLISRR
jgi:ElaB protein